MTEKWGVIEHMLALLVELTSVQAAGKAIKKPIEVPRPSDKPRRITGQSEQDAAFKKGIGVLRSTARGVS